MMAEFMPQAVHSITNLAPEWLKAARCGTAHFSKLFWILEFCLPVYLPGFEAC
jgi:hypothetical protein